MVIFSPIQVAINAKYVGHERGLDDDEARKGLMLISIVSVISQCMMLLIQTMVPYLTYKRNHESFQATDAEKQNNKLQNNDQHVISLLHILRHKYGFFLFLDQLVQELSFENISVLIEIYQFKYVTRNIVNEYAQRNNKWRTSTLIRPSKRRSKNQNGKLSKQLKLASTTKLSNIESGKPANFSKQNSLVDRTNKKDVNNHEKPWPSTVSELKVKCESLEPLEQKETSNSPTPPTPDGTSPLSPSTPLSADCTTPTPSPQPQLHPQPTPPSLGRHQSTDSEDSQFSVYIHKKSTTDSEYFGNMLSKLPWHGIPLTRSIITSPGFDKFIQAQNIYNKYIDKQSYYTINISSNARYTIEAKMEQLMAWKRKKKKQQTQNDYKDMDQDQDEEALPMPNQLKIPTNTSVELVRVDANNINVIDDGKEMEMEIKDIELEMEMISENDESESVTPPPQPEATPDLEPLRADQLFPQTSIHGHLPLHLHTSRIEVAIIESDEQFEDELNSLFDSALPDIFHNLEDSMMRFRKTPQFKALTESENH